MTRRGCSAKNRFEVLFVDDEPSIRLALGDALTSKGYAVTLAVDGVQALALCRQRHFDVVITDVRMPGIDGVALFDALRREAPETQVILITANADVEDAVDALKAGAADYLRKPFSNAELLMRVAQIAERMRLARELGAARVALSSRLGPYLLEEMIGAGGMGVVYRATHAMLKRPTAVKLIKHERVSALSVARFEREVQLTCQLEHPNTIAIYDYGRTPEGVFYYAMELLRGANVAEVAGNGGPLPPARAAHLLAQACGALAEAHGRSLIHRDIKPSNLYLSVRAGAHDVVKVLDFGLVKSLADDDASEFTKDVIIGTPAYLAPEAISAPGSAGPAADIYAIGAVAYFLMTGEAPFVAANVMKIYERQLLSRPTSFRARGINLPKRFAELVFACLERDPADRPRTMSEIAATLSSMRFAEPWDAARAEAWWRAHGEGLAASRRAGLASDDDRTANQRPRRSAPRALPSDARAARVDHHTRPGAGPT